MRPATCATITLCWWLPLRLLTRLWPVCWYPAWWMSREIYFSVVHLMVEEMNHQWWCLIEDIPKGCRKQDEEKNCPFHMACCRFNAIIMMGYNLHNGVDLWMWWAIAERRIFFSAATTGHNLIFLGMSQKPWSPILHCQFTLRWLLLSSWGHEVSGGICEHVESLPTSGFHPLECNPFLVNHLPPLVHPIFIISVLFSNAVSETNFKLSRTNLKKNCLSSQFPGLVLRPLNIGSDSDWPGGARSPTVKAVLASDHPGSGNVAMCLMQIYLETWSMIIMVKRKLAPCVHL